MSWLAWNFMTDGSFSLAMFAETQTMFSNSLQHLWCLHSYFTNRVNLVCSIPMWLLCSCSYNLGCSYVGILIHLPFTTTPSITFSSSLNVQYGCLSFCICSTWWPSVFDIALRSCRYLIIYMLLFGYLVSSCMQGCLVLCQNTNTQLHTSYFFIFVLYMILSLKSVCYAQVWSLLAYDA